ncbi:MAG TPA: molybdopterin-dependent oxidoreductase [Gammaproteobacteria bacterium]|nr:molybdopterin-dependent oxidoreductase [Gammaproteobacteria bacterium]
MSHPIRTNCPRDCYDACGILVERRDDGTLRVLGDPAHPIARGRLCSKCAIAYNGAWQDADLRLTHPLRRVGPRGGGGFERISWDEALATLAGRMRQAIERRGARSILHTHYSGTLSLIGFLFPNRLFNFLGASEVDPDTICNAAGHVAWTLLYGSSIQGFDPRTARDTRCVLVWGANPSHSAPHAHEHWLREIPGKVVVVDPVRTETAAAADLHLQPRPGTDAALAFSLLHCLRAAGRFDREFIAAHTLGAAEIDADIARATPAWGEAQTGVPAARIRAAAEIYGAGPSLLWCGQALQRQATGGNVMRAVGLLPALTGNVGKPGAGFCYLNVTPVFAGIDLGWLSGAALAHEPIHKLSHMHLAAALEQPDAVEVFFAWNTNPLASAPEQARLRRALAREGLYTVVSDLFMTDTARHADLVLPAASFLEYDDLTFGYFHLLMGAQAKAMEPPGEALPNAEIFRRLARALGLDEPALFETDEALIATMMAQMKVGFDFAELKRRGHFQLGDAPLPWYAERKFDTPSGRIEIASAQAEEMGLPRTPQPWADAPPPAGQFRLLTPASKWRLNDSYANDPHLAARSGDAALRLHPEDASKLGVADGDAVELVNALGRLRLAARIDDAVLPGTVLAYKGRWPALERSRMNVNVLHRAQPADMGESTSVHSTLVEVRRA